MSQDFNNTIPIYIQVMDDIKRKIASGQYKPNDKVESVRELALLYGVNPNTVQRALSELERINLLKTDRTIGRYISDDQKLIDQIKDELAEEAVNQFIANLNSIGYTTNDGIKLLKKVKGESNEK